ncbi:MAG: choice-of-anchor D domain-containing protein, partial [Deltaproteobacteria bacterium]|nr:choice-of-anchor D domain-containing protein [Deltaproteobacteria bacterium]
TLRNTGGSATTAITVAVAGTNPADFPIVAGGDGCSGASLPAMGTCTVAVQFNPTAAGARAATLRAQTASGTPATASLTGNGEAPAILSVTPTASDFGSVPTGATSASVEFTVTNTGTAASGVPAISLTGVQSTQWSIFSNGCTASLAGGASCSVFLRFSPTTTGLKTAVLNVSGTPGGSDTADLSGTGITPASVVLGPSPADFGSPSEDLEFTERTFTLSNSGMGPAAISAVTISGPDAAEFSVVAGGTCGATLAGGPSNCTIVVRYSPQDQGASAASLDVTVAPGGLLSAALTGTGDPDLEITPPATNNFTAANGGTGVIAGETATNDYIITNRTTLAAAFTGLTVASPTGMMEYTRITGFGGDCGATLAAGASCTVRIRFAPLATGGAGTRNVNLTVNATASSGAATETFAITGTARGAVRWISSQVTTPAEALNTIPAGTAATATFGTRNIGGNYNVTLTLRNDSGSSVFPETTGAFTGDMNIINDNCAGITLAAGGTCTVIVRFYPRTPGAAASSGTVTVASAGVGASIAISGTKVAGANVTVSPGASGTTTVTFPTTIATRSSAPTVFTLTNTGAVTSSTLSYGLVSAPRYSISATTCPASGARGLNAGESCTISVVLTPSQVDSTNVDILGTLQVSAGTVINTSLSGRASSQLTLTPTTASFVTGAGTTSATTRFTVTNVGATMTGSITVGTSGLAAEWPITNNTCATLAPSATCTFDVAFAAAGVDRTGIEVRASNGAYVANVARVAASTVSGDSQQPAVLDVQPSLPVFLGFVAKGTNSDSFTFTVRNAGDLASGPLTTSILPAFVAGAPACSGTPGATAASFYSITASTCTGPLAAGGSCTVSIRANPPAGGAQCRVDADWRVTDGTASDTGGLQMGTLDPATIFVTPTIVDFGRIVQGSTSATSTFTVTNGSAGNLTLATGGLSNDPTNFPVTASTCAAGMVLVPGGDCTFTVRFTPPAAGTPGYIQTLIGVLTTTSINAVGSAVGTALAPAGLTVTPADASPDYPTTVAGQTSAITYTVQNNGDVATASAPAITIGGADPSQFTVANNTCTAALQPNGVGAASRCTFDVSFAPSGAGARSATLNINAGGGATHTRTLSGTGIGAALLGISPSAPQTCPSRAVGTGAADFAVCTTYTISNGGGSASRPLTIAVDDDFLIQDNSTCVGGSGTGIGTESATGISLAALGTCTVIVQFAPQTVLGAHTGTLTVGAGAGVTPVTGTISSSATSGLTHSGSGTGYTAGTMDFGTVARGMFSARTPQITNVTSPSTGSLSYTITGANASDFDVNGDGNASGGVLGAGSSLTMNIRFLPSGTGVRTATLTITDGTAQKTVTITLTGTGT